MTRATVKQAKRLFTVDFYNSLKNEQKVFECLLLIFYLIRLYSK